jgi:hypothetical protein
MVIAEILVAMMSSTSFARIAEADPHPLLMRSLRRRP